MSVEVTQLYKSIGKQEVLRGIDLSIAKGEIVGLLGPNGAGKSTLMKILVGYWGFDSGQVNVCGVDMSKEPHAVAAKVGYLPELNPLYDEMYVREYLLFMAELSRVSRAERKDRVEQMIELTGITRERHKQLGQLSKGYRQRVGLAQALMGDPEFLILDEPTTGLDPNQLDDIRTLIRSIGQERTVLLSTHILQEVSQMCNRVVILNNGQIVAETTTTDQQDLETLFRQKTRE